LGRSPEWRSTWTPGTPLPAAWPWTVAASAWAGSTIWTPTRSGVTRALQGRVVLLVVPPQATTAAAGIAMAMAADAATSARPADILAAAGIGGQDPAPMPPQPLL
jgi:hypothetical protein